jgi:nitroreductase
MTGDDMLELIKSRRSVRHFRPDPPSEEAVDAILTAGAWAPSGLNNQPWSFAVVREQKTKEAVAVLTKYGRIVREAPALIAVFLDNDKTYDRTKDCQAAGACMQNMLLQIHASGLGAVWLGEILNSKEDVARVLDAPKAMELMGVVAFGTPAEETAREGSRRPLAETVFKRELKLR